MNKNIKTVLVATALALGTGCVNAGTWVGSYYYDGPICTVCDGYRVVQHTYGTVPCTHCNGTGLEPVQPAVVSTVVVDTWCPPPPPPRWHHHHMRPMPRPHHPPVRHVAPPRGGGHPAPRPAMRPAPRPAARPASRPAARPAPRPAGRQGRPSGGRVGRR